MSFKGRQRGTIEEAESWASMPGETRHVIANDDGTFSVMSHIVCEWCDYCDQGGYGPFPAKENPYEHQEEAGQGRSA